MQFTSTRNAKEQVSAAQAIVNGLASNGGLYVPGQFPQVDFAALQGKSYEETAYAVLQPYLDDYDGEFLKQALAQSYGENFGGKAGHMVQLRDTLYSLELWHGPTCAFKDYALQLMPRLLQQARGMLHVEEKTRILVATSGDTGTAALNGFKDIDGVGIAVFYPESGTSEIQRLQMVTQEGSNVSVFGVQGNFDDAQRGVKEAFSNIELAKALEDKGVRLSSANSINFGRLAPQIVYYVYSYLQLCGNGTIVYGQPVDYCVPTGNFGDILAGYYAKQMGLPIGQLLCASNQNNVLFDFLSTGNYNAQRDFYKTSSPSMDILVSSNLERLLWHESGADGVVQLWMDQLAKNAHYQIDSNTLAQIRQTFAAGWADEEEVGAEIRRIYDEYDYLCDPHTAVAFKVQKKQLATERHPVVVLSTANPFKFSGKVLQALGHTVPEDEFEALQKLQEVTGRQAPAALTGLKSKQERFTEVIDPAAIAQIPLTL